MIQGNAVGLDYHQHSVQVSVLNSAGQELGNRACANQWQAIRDFAAGFGHVARAAIESCAGAADLAEELADHAGWSVDLAHPGYVARMKGSPDKSDYSDAKLLGDLTRVGYLPKVWLAPQTVRELRRLVRYRQQLANEKRAVKLRIGAALREQRIGVGPAGRWTLRWLMWLESEAPLSAQSRWIIGRQLARLRQLTEEIKQVLTRLYEVTQGDAIVARLMAQRGVGEVTAFTLRAEIGRFDRFNSGKQLSRFCGLSPRNASSGQRQADAGLVHAANRSLRAVLIEAAHCLIRFDPHWHAQADAMLRRGKPRSVVVVAAVANRWVRRLYHTMKGIQADAHTKECAIE